jgi:nucleotide-binding universal stress UspA family protein
MARIASIIVGVDGHDGGWDAFAVARWLAHIDDAAITIACAYPGLAVEHTRLIWRDIALESDATRVLDQACARIGDQHGFMAVSGATPGSALQRLAASRGADLLVIGSSRRATLGRVLGGNVVAQALDDPPCAVAVAPRGVHESSRPLARIGVTLDRTAESYLALRWAAQVSIDARAGRTLQIIDLDEHEHAPDGGADAAPGTLDAEALTALRLAAQLSPRADVRWIDAARAAGPTLAKLTATLDLLVVGSHGNGPFGRLLHGGVARHLAGVALCPLVAVPVERAARGRAQRADGRPVSCR